VEVYHPSHSTTDPVKLALAQSLGRTMEDSAVLVGVDLDGSIYSMRQVRGRARRHRRGCARFQVLRGFSPAQTEHVVVSVPSGFSGLSVVHFLNLY